MDVICRSSGGHLEIIGRSFGDHVEVIWRLLGVILLGSEAQFQPFDQKSSNSTSTSSLDAESGNRLS